MKLQNKILIGIKMNNEKYVYDTNQVRIMEHYIKKIHEHLKIEKDEKLDAMLYQLYNEANSTSRFRGPW